MRALEWILLGGASTAAIFLGVRRHRPSRSLPWYLLAGAVASVGTGDVLFAFRRFDVAEIFYIAMFFLVAAGLWQFTNVGSLLTNRARLIDLVAFTCATLLVIWVFVIGSVSWVGAISPADVIGDLLLIVVAIRVIVATGRSVSAVLLLIGSAGMGVGDVIYPLFPGALTETGFIVLYVSWGLAALHPSMVRLTRPTTPRPAVWGPHWAILLGVSAATPPLVLLVEALTGTIRDGLVIALASLLTLALAITRLADSVRLSANALTRERGLRTASAALVSASDLPGVDEALRDAVVGLMPADAVRRVVFATDDEALAAQNLPASPPRASGLRGRSWWLDEPGEDRPDGEATLICPLWLEPLAVARPSGGALVLTGRRDVLIATRDALEVLAGQAALALDRITLVEAVGRRDSDLYLRAVVRNTADLMLVIDEDQRIRYSSPALRQLLAEDELPPMATLNDLVHPDDQEQLHRKLMAEGDGTLFCALRRADESQILVEATYRDLRKDRLVQGFVITLKALPATPDTEEHPVRADHVDELPAWVNRRSAQHKFRY